MKSFSDNILSIKGHLYERIGSPFSFTFLAVSFYYHWQILFITFDSSLSSTIKIMKIQTHITNTPESIWCLLIITLGMMIVYSTFSYIGTVIRELQLRFAKKTRNHVNVDYLDAEENMEVVQKLKKHSESLQNSLLEQNKNIQYLHSIIRLNDKERDLFNKLLENEGEMLKSKLSTEENKIGDILHKQGIFSPIGSKEGGKYMLNGVDYGKLMGK